MKTQLQATPALYGEDARRCLQDAMRKPTARSKQNAKKLIEHYSKLERKEPHENR